MFLWEKGSGVLIVHSGLNAFFPSMYFSIVNGPISYRNLWSGQKRPFTGPSNRAVFNKSLQDMYGDLYNKAKDMQTY